MRLLVVGAAGRTGREVVAQALAHGHAVTAFVHTTPLELEHPELRILPGDVLDFQTVSSAVLGQDAVVSALGHRRTAEGSVLADGIGNIIHAMATYRVSRLVAVSAMGAFARNDRRLSLGYRALVRTTLRQVYDELEAMERRIMASDLDWTIIRPTGLVDGPLTGQYRVALDGSVLPKATRIARADVAALAMKAAAGETYVRRAVTIGN